LRSSSTRRCRHTNPNIPGQRSHSASIAADPRRTAVNGSDAVPEIARRSAPAGTSRASCSMAVSNRDEPPTHAAMSSVTSCPTKAARGTSSEAVSDLDPGVPSASAAVSARTSSTTISPAYQ
jgi:hypothetical protein